MSTGPTNLYDLSHALLAGVGAELTTLGVTTPATAYVNGKGTLPVALCDSLVVGWGRVDFGFPGSGENRGQVRLQIRGRVAELSVWIFRCITTFGQGYTGLDFDPVAEDADALTILTDAYCLPKAIWTVRQAGVLGDYATGMTIGPCLPVEPQGGIAGSVVDLTVELS